MISSIRFKAVLALASVCFAATASAQGIQQLLKDVWVATPAYPLDVNFTDNTLDRLEDPETGLPIDVRFGTIRAMAFEPAEIGNAVAGRSLIFVDGTTVKRFAGGELDLSFSFDANTEESGLSQVNTVAVSDDGTVLFSGFSRRKRVYELWAYKQGVGVDLVATGTPQLTDAVYLSPADVAAAGLAAQEGASGVLAATAKAIMFFAEPSQGWISPGHTSPAPLADGTLLGLKGNTQLLSVDLVRGTRVLMFTTTDRKVLTTSVVSNFAVVPPTLTVTSPPQPFADVVKPATCTIRTPLLLVRNVRSGTSATSVVSDSCGQVVPYHFDATAALLVPQSPAEPIPPTTSSNLLVPGLIAIAVGEGNLITCDPLDPNGCQLTSGARTFIDALTPTELLVLQYVLCDPRVAGCTEPPGSVLPGNFLNLNSLLPQQIQDALRNDPATPSVDETVNITIPPYMFGAGPDGRFGALIVQTNDAGAASQATMYLEIDQLLGFKLGARSAQNVTYPSFVRGDTVNTTTLNLLNQDIVGYAPDNYLLDTVSNFPTPGGQGFQTTPATTGSFNPLVGGLRGFSVVTYGLQHDLNSYPIKRPRDEEFGGIPADLPPSVTLVGSTPLCELHAGPQHFVPVDSPERFYVNLVACLLVDQETLLNSAGVPNGPLDGAFQYSADWSDLVSRLGNVKDKLIKALTATGPNSGSTDFQAVASQLQNYRERVLGSAFNEDFKIYQNELLVRTDAFEFLLLERAYPSLPIGGFTP